MKLMNMENLPPEFEEILKQARDSIASDPSARQAVAVLTSKGSILCCVNHGMDDSVGEEEAFIKTLTESGDSRIQYAVCIWSDSTLDVPSHHLREMLAELNPSNREAKFLLYNGEGFDVKELQKLLSPGQRDSIREVGSESIQF